MDRQQIDNNNARLLLSWQQHDILLAVEKALRREDKSRIVIEAGHGIGKTATIAWLILWYLLCHKDAQVGCTSPTADQLYDVLWKELSKWLKLMRLKQVADLYEWSTTYIRIKQSPETWFARARTARKEAPEAFAGLHGKYVMLIGDEASGIPDEIYSTAEGSLTDKNILVILISNPTRLIGYFYEATHGKDAINWQRLQFSSLDSPIVDNEFNLRIEEKYGKESDEYRIKVLGLPPDEESVDDKGFLPVYTRDEIDNNQSDEDFDYVSSFNSPILSVDPSGEGKDKTVWMLRSQFAIKKLGEERISTEKTIANRTYEYMCDYSVPLSNVYIDGFGIGGRVAQELAVVAEAHGSDRANVVLTSESPEDENYLNIRAETAFRLKQFIRQGGKFERNKCWEELLFIRYRRQERSGRVQLMEKEMMRKLLGASPDNFDAACLLFVQVDTGKEMRASVFRPKV